MTLAPPTAGNGIAVALGLVGLALLGGCGEAPSQPSASETPWEELSVPALDEPAEILIDRWGVPHIYARSIDDVFRAQGFNAARDRLWQLDLWKRRGEGRLAEVFGGEYVEQDRAARLFLYRGSMQREWLAYASDTKRIATAFSEGINAYIELTELRPELLPPEFEALDYRPQRWSPDAVARIRSHGLLRNARQEVTRGLFLEKFGPEALAVRDHYEPAHELQTQAGVDPGLIREEWLDTYRLATRGVTFSKGDQLARMPSPGDEVSISEGSNNWSIAGTRTASGRPLLANDPHRTLAVPSLRYIVHLSAPGLHVIGAGEPALPGVSIGHNDGIAFGLTVFSIDQEDLYVYRTREGAGLEYRYGDGWERMTEVKELIDVRGADPHTVELRFTRHGPVIFEDPANGVAVALRAAWLEPGMAPYLGSIEYMRARTWDGFLAAMNRWGLPGENQVYADVAGNIGWKPGGLAPIRPNWDGLLPVPGDGRYEWDDFYDMDQLPVEANPERGWVATANQMNLPAGYPHQMGFEWAPPHRFDRIAEVLAAEQRVTLSRALELQTDTMSLPARRAAKRLRGLEAGSEEQAAALEMLRDWTGDLAAESAPAALFEVWQRRHLPRALWREELRRHALGEEAIGELIRVGSPGVLRLLDHGGPAAASDTALLSSLGEAWREVGELLGAPAAWRWGSLHHSLLEHPLGSILDALGVDGDVGPLPRGGSSETVGNTSYRSADFRQRSGASFRMILDVGAWDRSLAMNSPGQSGDPRSPHYRDLFEPWARDEAFPLLFSRPEVERETVRRLRLLAE
ncbi:MAG: penicillin acylase family protein [Acidobacteriota bacterium]|nr:penicillin acylase family protein [Acidobacteriota bacterium]